MGRSKQSQMVVAGKNIHVFAWAPWMGADSFGATLRRRKGSGWVHWRVILLQRNRFVKHRFKSRYKGRVGQRLALRQSLTLVELTRWTTRNGTRERDDLKSYLRLVLSPGGRRL